MNASTFRPTLRLFVRPVEGDSLRQTLLDLVAARAVARLCISGRGSLDAVRLARAPEDRRGPLQVIQLTGYATVDDWHVTLIALDEAGQLVGGELVDARAVDLELSIELLDAMEDAVVAPVAKAAVVAPVKIVASAAPPSWSEVAAASARTPAPTEDENEVAAPMPRPGDDIEHASFGACLVEKVDADEEFVMVRNTANRLMRLSLDILRLELVGQTGGHRHYRARVIKTADKRR